MYVFGLLGLVSLWVDCALAQDFAVIRGDAVVYSDRGPVGRLAGLPSGRAMHGNDDFAVEWVDVDEQWFYFRTLPAEDPGHVHCYDPLVTPGMRLDLKVRNDARLDVVQEGVSVRDGDTWIEVRPGLAALPVEVIGARSYGTGRSTVSGLQLREGPTYRPTEADGEETPAARWSATGELEGAGWTLSAPVTSEREDGLVEVRQRCVSAVARVREPLKPRDHLPLLAEPLQEWEARVNVVGDGTRLTWADGSEAGVVVGEALLPGRAKARGDRLCASVGLTGHYAEPAPKHSFELCFPKDAVVVERRRSTLLAPRSVEQRHRVLTRATPLRHPGAHLVEESEVPRCLVSGWVTEKGKVRLDTVEGCTEPFQAATAAGIARWRYLPYVVHGERVEVPLTIVVNYRVAQ